MRTTFAIPAFVLLSLIVHEARAIVPATTFSDGSFDDSQWSFTSIANDTGDGSVLSTQVLTGGNPDEYREVNNLVVTGAAQTRTTVVGLHVFDSAIYDPSIQGGIESISFSIDFVNIDVFGNGERYGPAIVQGGQTFVNPSDTSLLRTRENGTQQFVWQSLSPVLFEQSDFIKVDTTMDNLNDPSTQPDFSTSGSPMTLGFFTFNTNPAGLSEGFTSSLTVGYDNWEVAVNTVPEPATSTLALAALCLAMSKRRAL